MTCWGQERYHAVMSALIISFDFDVPAIVSNLWMTNEHLRTMRDEGHVIGLHSYSHPTRLAALSTEGQREEYRKNFDHLVKLLGEASGVHVPSVQLLQPRYVVHLLARPEYDLASVLICNISPTAPRLSFHAKITPTL